MTHDLANRPSLPRRTRRHLRLPALLLAVLAGSLVLAGPGASAAPAGSDPSASASWPLEPRPEVVARFDPPPAPWAAGHRGVDLLGTPGQAVRAAVGGTVAYAGLLAGKGVVVVRHGSTRTTYEPVDAVVEVGARVASGDLLGHLHPGGSHCLPRACLHWGLIEDTPGGDVYRDPLTLVGGGPVRLLPWAGRGAAPGPAPAVGPTQLPRPSSAGALGAPGQARGWAWR